jgi:hypothetical protein
MTIQDMRDGLAANIGTISGLRVSEEIPDQVNPPQAVISLTSVEYDNAFKQGLTIYRFLVTLISSRASDRWAQIRLDGFCSNGDDSVKLAIESDKTLSGSAFDVRVTEMGNIGTISLDETMYLAAEFSVDVYSD